MRLFGKKTGKAGDALDVPPELRPYYGVPADDKSPSLPGLLVLVGVLIFVMAALGGWLWQHDRSVNRQQRASIARSPEHGAPAVPVPSGKPDAAPAQTQPSESASPSGQATAAAPATASAAPNAIPNAGPGTTALGLAAVAGIAGGAAGYARSLRASRWRG